MTDRSTKFQYQYIIPSEYSFVFTSQPFGITLSSKSTEDVYVESVDEKSAASDHIVTDSKLIKIHNKSVEGLNAVDIMNILNTEYDELPLPMTFRKPLSLHAIDTVKNAPNINIVSFECNPRALFLDINAFYKSWRDLSSDVLLNALLIVTDIKYECILKPNKYNLNDTYTNMLRDPVFNNLLQWKSEQGLLFTVNTKKKAKIAAFWKEFSNVLRSLPDPSTYNTSKYNALKLDIYEYKHLDSFKYDVCLMDIKKEFSHLTLNVEVIKEILYRSDVLLDIYDKNGIVINDKLEQLSPSSFEEEEFDVLLDEITTAWNRCSNDEYVE